MAGGRTLSRGGVAGCVDVGPFHPYVPARESDACGRQHAVPVGFWRQSRGPVRPPRLPRLLSALGALCGRRADRHRPDQYDPDGRRLGRNRRGDGRLSADVPARPRRCADHLHHLLPDFHHPRLDRAGGLVRAAGDRQHRDEPHRRRRLLGPYRRLPRRARAVRAAFPADGRAGLLGRTHGRPPHPDIEYIRTTIPVVRRRRR